MTWISKVNSAVAFSIPSPFPTMPSLFLAATGEVPTSGWSGENLSPRYYVSPPQDGIWDFDFTADPPSGIVLDVVLPVNAFRFGHPADWVRGVRVHAGKDGNQFIEAKIAKGTIVDPAKMQARIQQPKATDIYQLEVGQFEDSWQPIGMCGLTSVRMKKLVHTLILTISGPDRQRINQCVQEAIAAGLIAAIAAVLVTGGLVLSAAIEAALTYLGSCLGAAYNVRFDDRSHWEEWCT
jgi:hypothetical protein